MPTTLTRWDPFQQIAQVQREMDRMLGITLPAGMTRTPATWMPATDIEQTEDTIVFKLEMPEMKKEDVSIEVHGRTLQIMGERHEEKEEKHEGYLARERSYGSFSRSFLLPEGTHEDDIEATFENGLLKVTVPRPRVETPHRVEISS
jgi:HSP20 family protein